MTIARKCPVTSPTRGTNTLRRRLKLAAAKPVVPNPISPTLQRPVDKIIVAIHGIGSQSRSSTIRTVASRFGDRSNPPLPPQPLGYFHLGDESKVQISLLNPNDPNDPLHRIGFAEIFWADIPKSVVKQEDLLEETKAWGTTVVGRAQSGYSKMLKHAKEKMVQKQLSGEPEQQFAPEDFNLGIAVVDEIVETVGVLEKLFAVFGKMGLFKFELGPLLRDYIGDVQLVADFPFQRDRILFRFHSALDKILEAFAEHNGKHGGSIRPEIYIVAHSEGTVISFIGMLEALTGKPIRDPECKDAKLYESKRWIADVRGYMTIGSPIDKHLLLWPELWGEFRQALRSTTRDADGAIIIGGDGPRAVTLGQKIKWRNYYDHADPIGFQLDTAVEYLNKTGCGAFEFVTKDHDIGFSRYWLPGKAHNDYWTDGAVFGHFIDDVISPSATKEATAKPHSRPMRGFFSTALPYAMSWAAHFGAVFLLYKGIVAIDPGMEYTSPALPLLALSVILLAITIGARLPRLVKPEGYRWHAVAFAFFLAGVACIWLLPEETVAYLTYPLVEPFYEDALTPSEPNATINSLAGHSTPLKFGLAAICFLITLTGWRPSRKPHQGRRSLLWVGTVIIGSIVCVQAFASAKPTWPFFLAALAFLYLWWLGILLFDLSFVWHRYIRNSVAIDIVREWRRGEVKVPPRDPRKLWKRPEPPFFDRAP